VLRRRCGHRAQNSSRTRRTRRERGGAGGRNPTAVGRRAPRARVSGVQGTVRCHFHVLRQRARLVRRVLVHHEQAQPGYAAQVSAVPFTARPPGGGRLLAAVASVVAAGGRDGLRPPPVARFAAHGGRPTTAAAGIRPQAARVHVHREGVVHLPSGRLPVPGIRDVGRHARVPVPLRTACPVHGALLPMVGRVRRYVPARRLRPPVLRLRRNGNVHITVSIISRYTLPPHPLHVIHRVSTISEGW